MAGFEWQLFVCTRVLDVGKQQPSTSGRHSGGSCIRKYPAQTFVLSAGSRWFKLHQRERRSE